MSSQKELRDLYKKANSDGKPGLTIFELRDFLQKLNPDIADRVVADAFVGVDKDKDRLISEDEFVAAMSK